MQTQRTSESQIKKKQKKSQMRDLRSFCEFPRYLRHTQDDWGITELDQISLLTDLSDCRYPDPPLAVSRLFPATSSLFLAA